MASKTQTAVHVTAYNPENPIAALEVAKDAPIPQLGDGEVCVKVTHRPVLPADKSKPVLRPF